MASAVRFDRHLFERMMRWRTVANAAFDWVRGSQALPALGGEVVVSSAARSLFRHSAALSYFTRSDAHDAPRRQNWAAALEQRRHGLELDHVDDRRRGYFDHFGLGLALARPPEFGVSTICCAPGVYGSDEDATVRFNRHRRRAHMMRRDSRERCVNEGCAGLVTQRRRSPAGVTSPAPARSEQEAGAEQAPSRADPSWKAMASNRRAIF
jgi:hypothetical protein